MARLEHVMARNAAELRQERGWTQRDLAMGMTVHGYRWTSNRATQVETLRRALSLDEMAALCGVFEVPLDRLLAGPHSELVDLPMPGHRTTLGAIRAALRTMNWPA